jgi:hypothetical protein
MAADLEDSTTSGTRRAGREPADHDATKTKIELTVARLTLLTAALTLAGIVIGLISSQVTTGSDDASDQSQELADLQTENDNLRIENAELQREIEGSLPDSGIAITNLRDAQEVPICTVVSGTGSIPIGKDLWVVVMPDEAADSNLDHWVAALVEDSRSDDTWESRVIAVGSDDDVGQRFTIYAALVTESHLDYLQSAGANLWNLLGDADAEPLVVSDLPPHDSAPASVRVVRSPDNTCD